VVVEKGCQGGTRNRICKGVVKMDRDDVLRVMVKTMMKHAGLSEFDREPVEEEAEVILKALEKYGFEVRFEEMHL